MDMDREKSCGADTERVSLPVERCRDGARLPVCARAGDAGMDVCAAEDTDILPGQTVIVPTGLKFAVPMGYELQVRPRSGISLRTALRIPNAPGTIDSGYRGEVGVIMTNTCLPEGVSTIENIQRITESRGELPVRGLDESAPPGHPGPCVYHINRGDRVAQLVLHKLPAAELVEVCSVAEIGCDRLGGFGSTGFGETEPDSR